MISELVSILSDDERVAFVKYLRSRNRRSEARNVELFRAMLSGKESEFKAELGTNAYNVLRSRLKERLIDFVAESTIQKEGSAANELSKTFITAKRLLIQGRTDSALKLLEKVENQAHAMENYILEGEVQQLLIEYAHVPGAPDLDELFIRSSKNFQLQQSRTKLNLAYARIRLAYQEVEFGGGQVDLTKLLNETFDEFAISDEIAFGFASLHQLIQLYDIYGAYSKNYHQINLFFIDKLKALQGSHSDNELNSHYHIEILYAIANIYFRKKDFKSSLIFLGQMKEQMDRFRSKQTQAYLLKHGMLSALNLNHMGEPERARGLIDEALGLQLRSNDTIQIRLALAMIQFQQGELRDCQRTLAKFSHTDSWYEKNLGIEWTLHKLTIEVLLHIDLENYDYAESRVISLLRKYKVFLNGEGKDQALPFLRLVQMILRDPTIVKTEKFHEHVENSIQWKRAEEEDVFRINFYAWLKAKMTGRQVYQTLLELLNVNNL
jgi:tetratricopeptide (TPR) repeat protein